MPGRVVHVRPAGWTAERRRGPLVLVTLVEPSYRTAAEALRAETAALSGPDRAAEELERLERGGH